MLDLDKNSDYIWLHNGKIDSEYYDLAADLENVELWNKDALDQMIEMVIVTEPFERLFNLAFGSPLYQILFDNFSNLDTIISTVFDTIEYWVPVTIDRSNAEIEADPDNNTLLFKIPYVSTNGLISGIFARRISR